MKNALVALLFSITLGVAVLSGWRYTGALKEKAVAQNALVQTNQQLVTSVQRLTHEVELRANLIKEKLAVENSLRESQDRVARLTTENALVKENVLLLTSEIKGLKQEKEEKKALEEKLALVEEANRQLEAKFHSLSELQKAIRRLRAERHKDGPVSAATIEITGWPKLAQAAEGNRGFLIKDGLPTYKPKLKIVIEPVQ